MPRGVTESESLSPPCLIVLNPQAGSFDPGDVRSAVSGALAADARQARFVELVPGRGIEKGLDHDLRAALEQGVELVAVAGGDGTISLVADRLSRLFPTADDGRPALAVLPTGTTNLLARELGIPLDLDGAAALLVGSRRIVELDAMRLGDRLYLTQIGVGLDALMIEDTSREARLKLGRFAYLWNLFARIIGYRSHSFTFHVDGRRRRHRAWQVIVANARTLGTPPLSWGPDIDPTDGVLNLCIYDVVSPWDFPRVLWRLLTGRHRHDLNTRYYTVRERVMIRAKRPLRVQADGEVMGETPIEVEVVPGAIRVRVPEKSPVGQEDPVATEARAQADATEPAPVPEAQRSAWRLLARRVAPLGAMDTALFLKLNALRRSVALDHVMSALSRLMLHGEAWVAAALAAWWREGRAGFWTFLDVVPVLWLVMLTVNFPIKSFFRRKRPFHPHEGVKVVGRRPLDASFPSGHTAGAFAGAYLMSVHYPDLAPLSYGFATVIAASRIYLGVHYPSDVVVGAAAGLILAVAYRLLWRLLLASLLP